MDRVLEFIKTYDKNIDNNTYLEITFGHFKTDNLHVLNTHISQDRIKEFIDYLVDYLKINKKKN